MCVLQQIVVYGSLYSVVCILHCRTGVDKFVIPQAPPLISKVPVLSYYDTITVQLLVKHVEMEIITSTVTYLILSYLAKAVCHEARATEISFMYSFTSHNISSQAM